MVSLRRVGPSGRRWPGKAPFALLGGLWALTAAAALAEPPAPTLVSPAGTIFAVPPTYTWNAVAGATEYQVYVYRGKTLYHNQWRSAASMCSGSTCEASPTVALASKGGYRWKVRARSAAGQVGAWSSSLRFSVALTNWNATACAALALGDFDGDGRTDRLCRISGVLNVSLTTDSGFGPKSAWGFSGQGGLPQVADMDRDGLADIIVFVPWNGAFYVGRSLGDRFAELEWWGTARGRVGPMSYTCNMDVAVSGGAAAAVTGAPVTGTADFDGDGRVDVYCKGAESSLVLVGLQEASGDAFSFSIFGKSACDSTGRRTGAADIDDDGRDDWYCMGRDGRFRALISTGTRFERGTVATYGPFCARVDLQVGDFNGDGRPDLHCGSNGHLAFGTGSAFLDQGDFPGACTPSRMFPADVDGDGADEVVCNNNGAGADDIRVRKWDGTTLTGATTWKSARCPGKVYPGDFNGDGRTDLLCGSSQVVAVGDTN